ncbi:MULTISPECIES: hypothetical protein [unclassified Wolbachia]|uniref:hypothetical protein n=1 Tax=unclassified Wolbachia TaxID=2640676 RepID=UPI0022328B6C|nr:hypothetical protein [Wolbachia endosymbiont (group A) of Tiphia femorata]
MPLTTLYNATYSTFNTYGVSSQCPLLVIQVTDTGMALLHSTLSSDGLRQIYVMISNLAIPISVNLLSK